jgi:hypothetical protein
LPCDPDIVAVRIKRADRRPQGWDLNLSLVRGDLDDTTVSALEHQFPGLGSRLAVAAEPDAAGRPGGMQSPHPVAIASEAVDNPPNGVQQSHPAPGTGCSRHADGVQPAHERGAAVAPEPYREPSMEPSAASARVDEARLPAEDAGCGGPASEFFAALGDAWRLTAAQRARLAPAALTALSAGWRPAALAEFTGSNTDGVRNPYAVLAARLSPAELPAPPGQPPRPPWCGQCDERTRMIDFDGDAPRPCPRCKPTASAGRSSPTTPSGLLLDHPVRVIASRAVTLRDRDS